MPKKEEKDDGTDRIIDAMNSLLDKKGGDSEGVIKLLLTENFKLRDDKRSLKSEISELRGKTPGEDAIILVGDDVDAWNSFKDLGEFKDVKNKLDKVEELQGELDKRDRSALIGGAAEVVGYNPRVLTELVEAKGLTVEMKDVEVEGEDGSKKTEKKPFIRVGEKADPVELTSYAKSNFSDFLPALTNTEARNDQDAGPNVPPQRRSSQTPPSKTKGETAKAVNKVLGQYKTPKQLRAEKE